METLVKKLNCEVENSNLPVLEIFDVSDEKNITLVQGTDYDGNASDFNCTDYAGCSKVAFIFRVEPSVVSQYRIYNQNGNPLQYMYSNFEPNKMYEMEASDLRPTFFTEAQHFGVLVNNPAPLANGTGKFEFCAKM